MLKTPNTRVKYLLALHGIDALSESSSTAVDPQILMQTMEIREQIDSICTLEELANVRQQVSHLIDDIIQRLAEVYDQRKDLEATKKLAVELQYMMKCAEEIEEKEEKLEATK
jgi:molecular chaperone HscB